MPYHKTTNPRAKVKEIEALGQRVVMVVRVDGSPTQTGDPATYEIFTEWVNRERVPGQKETR